MANALNLNLKIGDRLVMKNGQHVEIDCDMFGCTSFTSGTAIGIKPIDGSAESGYRDDGYAINKAATMKEYAKANGWTKETEIK